MVCLFSWFKIIYDLFYCNFYLANDDYNTLNQEATEISVNGLFFKYHCLFLFNVHDCQYHEKRTNITHFSHGIGEGFHLSQVPALLRSLYETRSTGEVSFLSGHLKQCWSHWFAVSLKVEMLITWQPHKIRFSFFVSIICLGWYKDCWNMFVCCTFWTSFDLRVHCQNCYLQRWYSTQIHPKHVLGHCSPWLIHTTITFVFKGAFSRFSMSLKWNGSWKATVLVCFAKHTMFWGPANLFGQISKIKAMNMPNMKRTSFVFTVCGFHGTVYSNR